MRGASEPSSDGRLITNFGLAAIVLFASGLAPLARLGTSAAGQLFGFGLADRLPLSWLALFGLAILSETFAAYWVHRLMHRAPLLWRMHRVHHADNSVDVSTSYRNHPLELLVTMPASAAVILALGLPPSVVVATQTVLTAATLWEHADLALPERLDRALSWIIYTPRLHRLHHSPERAIHDSNYGGLLTIWDRLFGTFTDSSERGRVGLDDQVARPDRLLEQMWSPVYAA